ncbi:DNA polymerase Y family protein [Amycolatopsis sp. NPDC058986]|uniref:DNA polymerase Y family protein n=1 Tax=unclassified Amycolatopsis TaxID=2618356 RepID=UPI00366BD305
MLVLWCPDWPAVAAAATAGIPVARPVAVFSANRVVACSAVARTRGVRRGMRRREAQSRCPDLAVFGADEGRDARLFEAVARAVEELVVGVEVVRPGVVAVPVSGAAGYFGGEHRLVETLVDKVAADAGVECQVGVSEGLFAATLAARHGELVEAGRGAEFLAPLPIRELDQPDTERAELVDLLGRLGLRTLGAFAELAERDVASRFGLAGVLAHRLARGRSERPPLRRTPSPELALPETFDPPLDRIDVAAFRAKGLGEKFHARLADRGLACTRLGIYATTEEGEQLGRVWRCAEPLTPHGVADRVRWQFESWLRAAPGERPTAGVERLLLEPEELVEGRSLQLGLWRGKAGGFTGLEEDDAVATERAGRAFARIQGLLGPEGVLTAVLDGGFGPADRVRNVPWGDRHEPSPADGRWDEKMPSISPATVLEQPLPAQVVDETGRAVGITARLCVTATPHRISFSTGTREIIDWALLPAGTRGARVQLLLAGDRNEGEEAVLVRCSGTENPVWTVEGMYD